MNSEDWTHRGGDVAGAVESLARSGRRGAWLWLEADAGSDRGPAIRRAWDLSLELLPPKSVGRRALWATLHFVVEGERAALQSAAHDLLLRSADASLIWRVVLIEVLANEAGATLACDPRYDLDAAKGSLVAWVRPYLRHRPGRYPTVTIVHTE